MSVLKKPDNYQTLSDWYESDEMQDKIEKGLEKVSVPTTFEEQEKRARKLLEE